MQTMWHISGRLGNQMFQFAYIYNQMKKGLVPDVYVQGENFFEESKEEIRTLYGDEIGFLPYVAIHVRRGDYVNNSFHTDLFSTDYYKNAMKEFEGAKFMVFSDDIEWCKQQEVFKECLFSEGFNEVADMNRMASCVGHIIANSSFSWWGAWLSPHKGKVIAPKQWFTDGIQRVSLPVGWLQI